jgi:hypothetical protein
MCIAMLWYWGDSATGQQPAQGINYPQIRTRTPAGLPGGPDVTRSSSSVGPTAIWQHQPDPRTTKLWKEYRDLDRQVYNLARQYRDLDKPKELDEKLREQIAELTAKQFELRQQMRELEIARLHKRLEEVETNVRKRKGLKQQIVEKRIVDLLDEDRELEWESTANTRFPTNRFDFQVTTQYREVVQPDGTHRRDPVRVVQPVPRSQASPTTASRPGIASTASNPLAASSPPPTNRLVPRVISVPVVETSTDENGVRSTVTRIETRTIYEAADDTKADNVLGGPVLASPQPTAGTARALTVAEAKARVTIVESKLAAARQRLAGSSDLSTDERLKLAGSIELQQSEVKLAEIQLQQAERGFEGKRRLLELDLRAAETTRKAAKAEFDESQAVNRRAPGSVPEPQLARQRVEVEQAEIAVERAKTVLELHVESGGKKESQR